MSQALRIVVLGYLVRGPMGGMAWHHLNYAVGLRSLGHDIYYVEDSEDYASCYDPVKVVMKKDPTYGLRFAEAAFSKLGLEDRWTYYDWHTQSWMGPAAARILKVCANADMLINVSGVNPIRSWTRQIPVRVLIDTDPAFLQIKHLTWPGARNRATDHNRFFSFAERIGKPDCGIPDDGFPWKTTRQPISLDLWAYTQGSPGGQFTTVMQWDSYDSMVYNGKRYAMKSASFERYLDIPTKTNERFQLAMYAEPKLRETLENKGWNLADPAKIASDPWAYQEYLRRSKGEFTVAKEGYVVSNGGWFSERSACYLATGRPVVTQETGFSSWLPSGAGVLSYNSPEEAINCLEEVDRRYKFHCRSARELAEEYFNAPKVLTTLIEESSVKR